MSSITSFLRRGKLDRKTPKTYKSCKKCWAKVAGFQVFSYCAPCPKWRKLHPPPPPAEKKCGKCREIKPVSEFPKNKDKHHSLCKICSTASTIKWRKDNPEKATVIYNNYRVRLLGNGGEITPKEWKDLKEYYKYTCLACGRREPEIKLELDHVMPIRLGGRNVIENAQPLCKSCNCSKGAKHIDYRPKFSG